MNSLTPPISNVGQYLWCPSGYDGQDDHKSNLMSWILKEIPGQSLIRPTYARSVSDLWPLPRDISPPLAAKGGLGVPLVASPGDARQNVGHILTDRWNLRESKGAPGSSGALGFARTGSKRPQTPSRHHQAALTPTEITTGVPEHHPTPTQTTPNTISAPPTSGRAKSTPHNLSGNTSFSINTLTLNDRLCTIGTVPIKKADQEERRDP